SARRREALRAASGRASRRPAAVFRAWVSFSSVGACPFRRGAGGYTPRSRRPLSGRLPRGDVSSPAKRVQEVERVAIRFAGDSGDGMQVIGTKFTEATALAGNDLSTFPDFPAEIRAPAGSPPAL